MAFLQSSQVHAATQGEPAAAAPASSGGGQVEEVVVTARKRAERLQKVPIAVTAFTAADLAKNPIHSLIDIQRDTPNLSFRSGTNDPFTGPVSIRGQYPEYTNLSAQPSVGIYIDDVYQATSGGISGGGLFDVDRIEVLKGPQGTLYGRNSTGGAIKIGSPLPSYDGFSGKAKFGYGNYGANEEGVAINVPLIDDKLAMRISGEHLANDGYGHIIGTNTPLNDADSKSIRAAFRATPIDKLELIFRADYAYATSHGNANNLLYVTPGFSTAILNEAIGKFGLASGLTPAGLSAANTALSNFIIPGGSHDAYSSITDPQAVLRQGGVSLAGTYDITDDLSFKSITAYRGIDDQTNNDDIGVTPDIPILNGHVFDIHLAQITQEFQLNGKGLDSKLKYTIGYYYFNSNGDEKSDQVSVPFASSFVPGSQPGERRTTVEDTSHAIFGQGTYALTDTVNFTAGLRWTTEALDTTSKSFTGDINQALVPGGAYICNALSPALPQPPLGKCFADYKSGFRNISYTFGLDWSPTDNLLLYAKTSRGFKAGGINTSGDYNSFLPEIVTDYEVGLKSDWLDKKLRVNTAVFYSDFNNIQRPLIENFPNNQIATELVNAASASITGIELETIARPIDSVELRANAAFLYPKYDKFQAVGGVPSRTLVDPLVNTLATKRFDNVPRWHTSVSAAYTYPFDFGNLRSSIDWTYQSSIALSALLATPATAGLDIQNGYSTFDARVALKVDKYDLEVAGFVNNLTDKRYFQNVLDLGSLLGVVSGQLGPPRTFGFEITKYF